MKVEIKEKTNWKKETIELLYAPYFFIRNILFELYEFFFFTFFPQTTREETTLKTKEKKIKDVSAMKRTELRQNFENSMKCKLYC